MSEFLVKIDNILGGTAPTQNFGASSQFDSSLGIDPDMPVTDASIRTSGMIRPTAMVKFSSTNVTAVPLWFLTNPKNNLIYAYMNDGKIVSYTSALTSGSETLIGTPTAGAGNGAEYYDNYLYFTTATDVARYGPLNGAPSLNSNYWTTTLSKAALVNTTYPTVNGITMPNHIMHYHAPTNRLYFVDVVNGKGTIHYIATTKNTVEGDTNNGSTASTLTTTPWGYLPMCMGSLGTDLAIGCVQGTDSSTLQRNAVILFWDTAATAPNKTIAKELPDPLITAMRNVNNILYVWLGNAQGGTRVIKFAGGYSWQEVAYFEETLPPFHGATDHNLNRIVFGGNITYPEAAACVWALGSKSAQINLSSPNGLPVFNILKSTSSGANGLVTALKYVTHGTNAIKQPIVGWKDGSSQGIDKITTGGGISVWRSQVFRVGKPFSLNRIRIAFTNAIDAGTILTPKFYVDELAASQTLQIINNTNYPNADRQIAQRMANIKGKHSFFLELRWTGTSLLGVSLPITIHGEVLTDGTE